MRATPDKRIPKNNCAVCLEHFTPDSFQKRFSLLIEPEDKVFPRLIRDDIGIVAYPAIHKSNESVAVTARDRRMVGKKLLFGR